MRLGRGPKPYHRRDWRRLWRYCRCGWRWRCPDSVELVPMPYQPPPPPPLSRAEYRAAVRAKAFVSPIVDAPPPARDRMRNRRPAWDTRVGTHPRLLNGRAGSLTRAGEYRARHGERVGRG
ncbi:hypothetical protein ABNF97_07390 [Plantactinospora sp. B6F1]|uniref:hypothetical protein n=1 Tax=Plantactinospora sp. B6F1 TaxID=3158971 RepID=UPI00102C9D13